MYILNYIYFLIITLLSYKYLTAKHCVMKNPLDKKELLIVDGSEMFWILFFSTGLLAFSAPRALELMGIRLILSEIFCVIGLYVCSRRYQFSTPVFLYLIYLVWIIIGVFYSPAPSYGFRVVLKYIYPLLVILLASAVVRDEEVFLKASLGARFVALISIIVSFVPGLSSLFPGVFWYGTARAINYISICIFSLSLFFLFPKGRRKNLFFTILFMLPCFIWVFRTSIMGTFIALMALSYIRYKSRSIPIILGILLLGAISVFAIPSLREKMFKESSSDASMAMLTEGKLSMDDVETNTRAAMWEYLDEAFFNQSPVYGCGTGAVQNFFYSNHVFGGLKLPHNDFIQIRCDGGIIALILYTLIYLAIFMHCYRVYHQSQRMAVRICALTAGATFVGIFATHYSDNVISYSMATITLPAGFYGMMLGLRKAELDEL